MRLPRGTHSRVNCSCDDNPSVCSHLVDTGAIASIFTIASQSAAPTVRALGACIIASAVGPTPDALAVLLGVLHAVFAVNVADASLELCSRLASQVNPPDRTTHTHTHTHTHIHTHSHAQTHTSRIHPRPTLPIRMCPCTRTTLSSISALCP